MMSEINEVSMEHDLRSRIIEAYKDYVLMHGHEPASIYAFCKELEIEEGHFYEHFNTFSQVADAYWDDVLNKVIEEQKADAEYANYSAREKLLSFYYEFFNELKKHRSYALLSFQESIGSFKKENMHLDSMKKSYKKWIKSVIRQGMQEGEIAERSQLSNSYETMFWWQLLWLINFWKGDRSNGFQKTDAAIEKSVNLSFDLIEKNALDSAFDFGKFMFQNR